MAKRSNQKPKLLYLSKIFSEQTDEQHPLRLSEIISELNKYGISAGRKSLYDDIETLKVFGLDIKVKRNRYVGYYLDGRQLDEGALRIVSDAIESSSVMTKNKKSELLKKVSELAGFRSITKRPDDALDVTACAMTEDAYRAMCVSCRALAQDRKITFKYFEWNSKKQRILKEEGRLLTLNPISLICENGDYKLLAVDDSGKDVQDFWISGMISSAVSSKKRVQGIADLEKECYEILRLRCKNEVANNIFCDFGTNVTVLSNRDDSFEISLKAKLDQAFWCKLFSYGKSVRILSPEHAEKEFIEQILNIQNEYNKI